MSNLAVIKNQQVSGSLTINSMDDLARLSDMMAKSGFFKDCQSAAQAGVKILAGLEIGVPAFAALSGIHIIQGKPALGANVMAAMIKRSGRYNYRVVELSDKVCRIAFYEDKEEIGVSEVLMTEIAAAKINYEWDRDKKEWKEKHNWKSFPKNMLFARAISNGIKWYCPDLFLGAPVYTPEELGAEVNEDGEVISVSSSPVQRVLVVQETSEFAKRRIADLMQRTGFSITQIESIASKQKPPIDLDSMPDADVDLLRNAVYAAWGAEQPGAFKANIHAWNAFKKLLTELESGAGDGEVWEAWQMTVRARTSPATVEAQLVEEF